MTRVSVTLRIDTTLWERFRSLESRNAVGGRSEFIELALAEAIHRAEERTR
jgi:metal-responsive CopG/Arc/MetJ family transcriptional regulator